MNINGLASEVGHDQKPENENPGALAGATGAVFEAGNFEAKQYGNTGASSNRKSGNIIARVMAPQHKQMSRLLGYSLLLGTSEAWQSFGYVAAVRLTTHERAFMAAVLLATLDLDMVEDIAATAVGAAGDPLPPFLGGMADARAWAEWASPAEIKAYGLACFEAMAPKDQAGFYRHISTVEVAA